MPPRSPIDTSATTVPITADAAASRRAGTGTAPRGQSEPEQGPPPADAVAAHQVEVGGIGDFRPRSMPTATGKKARYAAITATE